MGKKEVVPAHAMTACREWSNSSSRV